MELADLQVIIRSISNPGCLPSLATHDKRGAGSSGPGTRHPRAMDIHPQAAGKNNVEGRRKR